MLLGLHTGGAGLAIVLNKGVEEWLSVVILDELKGFVLAKVSRDWMVVFVQCALEIDGYFCVHEYVNKCL